LEELIFRSISVCKSDFDTRESMSKKNGVMWCGDLLPRDNETQLFFKRDQQQQRNKATKQTSIKHLLHWYHRLRESNLTMVFYLSCTLPLALSSLLSLLVLRVDLTSAWGGPSYSKGATTTAAPRRRRQTAFCMSAAAASGHDEDEHDEGYDDEDEEVLVLKSSRGIPPRYPLLLSLPVDCFAYQSRISILWEPNDDGNDDFLDFEFQHPQQQQQQQQYFESDEADEADAHDDEDQECSIPDEYKQLATSDAMIQAHHVLSFLGIQRAKAIQLPATSTTKISTMMVSAVSSLYSKLDDENDKQDDNMDSNDAEDNTDHWQCDDDDPRCNSDLQECSFPDEYKQLSTPTIHADVMSFLGIKRVQGIVTTTTTTTASSSSSSLDAALSSHRNDDIDNDDDDPISSPSPHDPASRISEWE
jgi:hypothetical protein